MKIAHHEDIKQRQTVHLRRLEERSGRLKTKQEALDKVKGQFFDKIEEIQCRKRDGRTAVREMGKAKEQALKWLANYKSASLQVDILKADLD